MMQNNRNSLIPVEWTGLQNDRRGRFLRIARVLACVAIVLAVIVPAVQLQVIHVRNYYSDEHKDYKGAQARWSTAARSMWRGNNIYIHSEEALELKKAGKVKNGEKLVSFHPNMPFTVILLSAFAYLPWWLGPALFTLLKLVVIFSSFLAAASVCRHDDRKMPDWVVALGITWGILMIISDIQHANLNCFALGAILLHLWLYRKGKDTAAGAALALAICLKMTPVLFVLYWLYQRNWRLLGGCISAGIVMGIAIPAVLLGPGYYMELAGTWMNNLVLKNAAGSWYPMHTNQSWLGVVSRYFIGEPHWAGNIFFDPEAGAAIDKYWITVVDLGPGPARFLVTGGQLAIAATIAWAIGLKKLARDDGRRGVHYGMILTGMMLLNQRTWDHHAAVMLPAFFAGWYAIGFARFSSLGRKILLATMVASGLMLWLSAGELLQVYAGMLGFTDKDRGADIILAYGPRFYFFITTLAVLIFIAVSTRKSLAPYAEERQTLKKI